MIIRRAVLEQLAVDAETAQARAEERIAKACAAYNASVHSMELARDGLEAARAAGATVRS